MHDNYVLSSAGTASTYKNEKKWEKSFYNVLNMDVFLKKLHQFASGGLPKGSPPHPTPGAAWRMFYYGWMHFIWLLGLLKKNTHPCQYKAWKSKDFCFKYNSNTPRVPWGWVKHEQNFIFGWTNHLKLAVICAALGRLRWSVWKLSGCVCVL